MDNTTKAYPGWKHALDVIADKIDADGYGCFFSHDYLKKTMDIEEPKTIEEYRSKEFEYLSSIENLRKELLADHYIWLENNKGEGYTALMPDDQISIPIDRLIKKSLKTVNKAASILLNVNQELLSIEGNSLRLRNMQKTAFLKQSFRKRKFPELKEVSKKELAL